MVKAELVYQYLVFTFVHRTDRKELDKNGLYRIE